MVYSPYQSQERLKCLTICRMMSLQRQQILLSYFKTLGVGPVWSSNPRQQIVALSTELIRQQLDPVLYCTVLWISVTSQSNSQGCH